MKFQITPEKVFEELKSLPGESLKKVWEYIQFIQYTKKSHNHRKVVKLGGILTEYDVDVSEKDIAEARREMWNNLGEIN